MKIGLSPGQVWVIFRLISDRCFIFSYLLLKLFFRRFILHDFVRCMNLSDSFIMFVVLFIHLFLNVNILTKSASPPLSRQAGSVVSWHCTNFCSLSLVWPVSLNAYPRVSPEDFSPGKIPRHLRVSPVCNSASPLSEAAACNRWRMFVHVLTSGLHFLSKTEQFGNWRRSIKIYPQEMEIPRRPQNI